MTKITTVLIKQAGRPGCDNQMFRAYTLAGKPLGISASTTGNPESGAKRCAAKAFAFIQGAELPRAAREQTEALNQIEPHIEIRAQGDRVWHAALAGCYDICLLCPPQPLRADPPSRRLAGSPSRPQVVARCINCGAALPVNWGHRHCPACAPESRAAQAKG